MAEVKIDTADKVNATKEGQVLAKNGASIAQEAKFDKSLSPTTTPQPQLGGPGQNKGQAAIGSM